jgi:hypothetical protein
MINKNLKNNSSGDKLLSGIFPLIGAIANCSSYQNPRRVKCDSLKGLCTTRVAAKFADINNVYIFPCFMLSTNLYNKIDKLGLNKGLFKFLGSS